MSNGHAVAFYDAFPVSPGHVLVIPKRHVMLLSELSSEEFLGCFGLVHLLIPMLQVETKAHGFNIGANLGTDAGQTVLHAHIHIIPRFAGDVADPRGGVRGVIPAKQRY
jgi:diadenosine tetraphosphate (Ap4A) HIT family hydrolase